MSRHLVLIGGGHAHLTTLVSTREFAKRGHRVTLVSPTPFQYYSGMGPGMLSGIYRAEEIRFNVQKMVEEGGGTFVPGHAVRIDPASNTIHLDSGATLQYDTVSFNTGSEVPVSGITISGDDVFTVKPITNLLDARRRIMAHPSGKRMNIAVIGGGAAGVEVAGNVWRLCQSHGIRAHIAVVAGSVLLRDTPARVRKNVMASFGRRGIEVIEGEHAVSIDEESIALESGRKIPRDVVFLALGTRPAGIFRDSGLPTGSDGGLLVNHRLQSVEEPAIFGGGDCISLEGRNLAKVGVYAVRQNPVLLHNLMAALEGRRLETFDPGGAYMLIFNMGDGRGIAWKGSLFWHGRLAFLLKDYIDRRFMRKFRV